MVREYNDGEYLFGSDLEHSVTTPAVLSIVNFLNGKKTTVDSNFLFTEPKWIHYGIWGATNINAGSSSNVDLTQSGGQSIPYAYGSVFDDFQDGSRDTTTRWTDVESVGGGGTASVSESGGILTVSATENTFGQTSQAYAQSKAGQIQLDVGSVLYIDVSASTSDTASATARARVRLTDGSNFSDVFTQTGDGSSYFRGAIKVESSTNVKVINFETNSVSNLDVTSVSLPMRIRYHSEAIIGEASSQSASATINVYQCFTGDGTVNAEFVTTTQEAFTNSKYAIGWMNVKTINDSFSIINGSTLLYSLKNENSSYGSEVNTGLEIADCSDEGTSLQYKFIIPHVTGSPIWVDSWGAIHDFNVLN